MHLSATSKALVPGCMRQVQHAKAAIWQQALVVGPLAAAAALRRRLRLQLATPACLAWHMGHVGGNPLSCPPFLQGICMAVGGSAAQQQPSNAAAGPRCAGH